MSYAEQLLHNLFQQSILNVYRISFENDNSGRVYYVISTTNELAIQAVNRMSNNQARGGLSKVNYSLLNPIFNYIVGSCIQSNLSFVTLQQGFIFQYTF